MKILMLTPYLPYPPTSGGQIRSYNLLKQLYKKHDITLFCYIRNEGERKFIPEVERYCKKVKVFKRRRAWSPLNVLLSGLSPYPFLVVIYLTPEFQREVETELKGEDYDLIHCENNYIMTNIPQTSLPIVLVDQTMEYLVYQHFVKTLKFWPLKPLLNIDVAKLKFWERRFWKRARKVIAVTEADKREMLRLEPDLDVSLVPNGVDLEFFTQHKNSKFSGPKRILFTSNFKWLQNVEAAELLINKIFPLVREKIPDCKLWIVGQYPPKHILELKSSDVIIEALPEDDLEGTRRAYKEASIFVSPVRGPGGSRLKNLAAMASRLPIVTTTIGAQGIGVENGEDVLVRDQPQEIADAIVQLFKNPTLANKLAKNARRLAEKEFSWEVVGKRLEHVYEEATRRKN